VHLVATFPLPSGSGAQAGAGIGVPQLPHVALQIAAFTVVPEHSGIIVLSADSLTHSPGIVSVAKNG
jgi:hypothetical protein